MVKIYVLCHGSYAENTWSEIDEKDLGEWLKDGSIKEDDIIIYPKKIMKATRDSIPYLKEVKI